MGNGLDQSVFYANQIVHHQIDIYIFFSHVHSSPKSELIYISEGNIFSLL